MVIGIKKIVDDELKIVELAISGDVDDRLDELGSRHKASEVLYDPMGFPVKQIRH